MLQDLDATFKKILLEKGNIKSNEIDISFEQPVSEWSSRLSRPTINLWAFDIRENLKLRSLERNVSRQDGRSSTSYGPRRMDVMYLVTAWARKASDEHQLLWRALSVFKQYMVLPPAECEGLVRFQSRDMPIYVADMSDHGVNMPDLWGVLDNQMRLGFTIVITVELDVSLSIEAPLVLDASIRVGQSQEPQTHELTALDAEIHHQGDLDDLNGSS
ncbi:DUF4255 domain-containing protein [Anaerolineales bacterium]